MKTGIETGEGRITTDVDLPRQQSKARKSTIKCK